MMVDWFTGVLPCDHDHTKLSAGLVASISATGDIEWTVQKALSVEGSHSSTIQIKSLTDKTIEISGNPAKWLQGHNIFGSDDLVYLVNKFFTELLLRKGVELGLSLINSSLNVFVLELTKSLESILMNLGFWMVDRLFSHGSEPLVVAHV